MKPTPHLKNIVVLRDYDEQNERNNNLLRLILCNEPSCYFFLGCLNDTNGFCTTKVEIAIPQRWMVADIKSILNVVRYTNTVPVHLNCKKLKQNNSWICISDGRFFTSVDNRLISHLLINVRADVLAVNVIPRLCASYEKVLTTSQNELVGFRMFYEDAVQIAPVPYNWPHHLFIRAGIINNLVSKSGIPAVFDELLDICNSKSHSVQGFNIGGTVLDLAEEDGFLKLVKHKLGNGEMPNRYLAEYSRTNGRDDINIADSARLFGKILFGKGVNVGENSIIVGPAIIGNNVKVGRNTAVRESVIDAGLSLQSGEVIEKKVLIHSQDSSDKSLRKTHQADAEPVFNFNRQNPDSFRKWPRFSYVGFAKRILDVIASVIVLVLFAPFLPVIMLAIKLTSPGPVFFKDTRQGLYGRPFKCLKFRTMEQGADKMQDRLRVLSVVKGPQFMIPDDPRMSAVGKFLRETYIDEIPQFFNVLLGQMSVVGPRPSPESENRLCPFWRDARLSVRPGITGYWQICRTRQPMKDFQEWIYYDVKYVRDLSLKLDLWLSWLTARKMVAKFISQF
jgi:lipopolysaccharide/colanic/teichoic acid biosynthesis glycosyltransferase